LNSGRYGVRVLVKLMPSSHSPLCFWDGTGDISAGGDTYVGMRGKFSIEPSQSAKDLSIRNLNIKFSGLDPDIIGMVAGVAWQQRPVLAQRATFAPNSPQILHLFPEFSGFMDTLTWSEIVDGTTSCVLACESASRELSRSGSRTSSDADQRSRDSSDAFFSAASSAVSQTIDWGPNPQAAPKQKAGGLAGFLQGIFG